MLYKNFRLRVKGSFSEKGFGFSCMRLAYQNNITGSLFYESSDSVIIEITGFEEDIKRVIEKCKKEDYITNIHILSKAKTAKKINDFMVLNQID